MNSPESFEQPTLRDKYLEKVDKDGYIYVRDFATTELRRQSKSVAGLLDGEEGTVPEYNLGEGLKFKGTSGNYSDMQIHIDDVDVFVGRVRNHHGE